MEVGKNLPIIWQFCYRWHEFFLSFKTLSWKMSVPLYLILHKNVFNKKDSFDCSFVLCCDTHFVHFHMNQFEDLLIEAMTADGGKMLIWCWFECFIWTEKFSILILLERVSGAFKNCSRFASPEPFHSAEALLMKVCLDSKRSFRFTYFLFHFFI